MVHRKARIKRHVPKKKRSTTPAAKWLSRDEPIGKYRVDGVAEELFAIKAKGESRIEFVRKLRNKLNLAAERATTAAREFLIEHPRRLQLTKRLFGDLDNKHFQKLLQRAAELSPTDVVLSSRNGLPPPAASWKNQESNNLLTTLRDTGTVIRDFLATFRPQGNPGNHDPLLRVFVGQVFELWRDIFGLWRDILWLEGLRDEEQPSRDEEQASRDEEQLFIRLVAAAWQDFQFPPEDAKGQLLGEKGTPLEEWIASRVKAHFPEGVRESRLTFNWEDYLEYAQSCLKSEHLAEDEAL